MTDRIGQVFGNYRLTHVLGQGGFADVYLGEHVHLNTQAAIKVLRTQLTSSDVVNFRNEARMIAHLEHPNIVQVLDFGVEGNTPFLVMLYAPGGTLRQRHPRGSRLPTERIVFYVQQVASALQYAHHQRLIHRDIKPENMLLGRNNEVWLSDFGIALLTPSTRAQSLLELSSSSEMAGTLPYMAPEQIQGRPSPASDQYALGVVVYEWLCGTPPFTGSYMEIALQHVSALPPLLREKDPTTPADIEKVVLTALAKDPERRFASVQAFATALGQAFQREPSWTIASTSNTPQFSSNGYTKRATLEAMLHGPFGRVALGSSVVTIGRTPSNQLVIDDLKVSSQHAEIRPSGQGHRIMDLNSANGTFVNEQWLAPGASRPLNQGDMIRVGDTRFSYAQSSAMPGVLADNARPQVDSRPSGSVAPALTPALPPLHTGYGGSGYQVGQPVVLVAAAGSGPIPSVQPYVPSQAPVAAGPPDGANARPEASSRPSRRVLWIVLSLLALLLMVSGGTAGVLAYRNSLPTPSKTLDTFCTALQNKDYEAAYQQLSSRFQNKTPEPLFASFFANVSSCTHSAASQAGNTATATLTTVAPGQTTPDNVTLAQDSNNAWKIDNDTNLSGLTKTLNTYCTALQQGDYPTAYSQLSGTLQSKITESQLASFFPKVSSCTYTSVALSATGATTNLTIISASGQTQNNPVSLIQDSSSNWKINDMTNLPDKVLDTFCTALQNKDYQTAYNQTSVAFQGSYPESQFAKDFSVATSCTHDSAAVSNGIVAANVTFSFTSGQTAQYRVSLVRDNTGNWKIDTLVYPPEVPLATFCTAIQNKDYQTAYDQTSAAFQNAVPESQFVKAFSAITTCTYDFPTLTGNIATTTMTLGNSSGQTVKTKVILIQDENGDWKIDSFQQA